ncbi:hypothetical protein HK103_000500 [Boothiomyces macroporosus]|uniref:Uncharacterized protein n=1 Tax=Boothiomyces macroporosus TaxID=261099 RepID=A0AAD5UBU0_9FUNG|nr:hypothetical protein HK103_000500 [Boothiomyces macroporosus]
MAFVLFGRRIRQRLVFLLGTLVYFGLIIVCTVINNQSFNNRQFSGVGEGVNANVNVSNQIISFSPTSLTLNDAKDFLQQISSAIPITDSNTVTYPFDTYAAVVSLLIKDFASQKPIPFSYDFTGDIDLWRSDIEPFSGDQVGAIADEKVYVITLKRTTITILFSIFLYLIMWVLSSAAFFVTLSIWTRGRKVEPPTIAAVGAILFALPNIRNAQPGAPAVGCNADILAFFPCMLLVTASVAMGLINYVTVYKSEKKVAPADDVKLNTYSPVTTINEKETTPLTSGAFGPDSIVTDSKAEDTLTPAQIV